MVDVAIFLNSFTVSKITNFYTVCIIKTAEIKKLGVFSAITFENNYNFCLTSFFIFIDNRQILSLLHTPLISLSGCLFACVCVCCVVVCLFVMTMKYISRRGVRIWFGIAEYKIILCDSRCKSLKVNAKPDSSPVKKFRQPGTWPELDRKPKGNLYFILLKNWN